MPGGAYFVEKSRGNRLVFRPRTAIMQNKPYYYLNVSKYIRVPDNLRNKRLMIKVEVIP